MSGPAPFRGNDGTLDRRAVVAMLLRDPGGLLVVTGLGAPTYDAAAAGDRPLNFYLWGAMGGAAMTGLGLALAQPQRRVLVITGDGEMLMGLGSLASIGAVSPPNLAIAVLDNARFGETGSQPSHTAVSTDLEAVARACGWRNTATVRSMEDAAALAPRLRRESLFAVIRISPEDTPKVLPPRDGALLTSRFRQAVGITPA
jgi:thiamine pyrophosphate-dependent acetolactate synthase large subunit-like protein